MAGGAASIGSVKLTDTGYARMRTMLLACVGIAFSAFVGSITSRIDWLAILVAGLWGIGAGLLVALGQSALIIGLQSCIALIILSHFKLDPFHATIQALLMLAGALFQTLLTLIPGSRTPERNALSAVYQALADYASEPTNKERGLQIRAALLKAYTVLSESNVRSRQGATFFALYEEAERLRLSILVFRRWRRHLSEDRAVATSSIESLDQFLQAAADQLQEIANDLRQGSRFISRIKPYQEIKQSLTAMRRQGTIPLQVEMIQPMLTYANGLRERLHIVKKLAKSIRYQQRRKKQQVPLPTTVKPGVLQLHDARDILRANLSLRSAVFRHAIRLGVALALATALYRLVPLPFSNGYWIPLTMVLVLRPEFQATFSRGIARFLGTLLGAILATVLIDILKPGLGLLTALDIIAVYCAYAVFLANYALFALFFSIETIFLLTLVTGQPLTVAEARVVNTAIGGVLALLIYIIWPTWERSQVPSYLADRLEALCTYCVAVLRAYADPSTYDEPAIQRYRMESRLARSNAEASIERSLHEPEHQRIDADLAQGLLDAEGRIAQSVLTLEAYLRGNPARHAQPEMAVFVRTVEEAFHLLATAIREERSVFNFPDLQKAFAILKRGKKPTSHLLNEVRADQRFVFIEAKHIIRSLEAMYQLLATRPSM
jgi:uncharacterized membrane protein YccC